MIYKQNQESEEAEKLKEIPKWTRRYTENRTLPFLVNMLTFLFLFLGIAGLSYLGGNAYRSGNMLLFWICIFIAVLVYAVVIFFSVPKWSGRLVKKLNLQLYHKEGQVTLAALGKTKKTRRAGWIVGLLFGVCVMISVILVVFCKIPIKYMQPVSAICFIPLIIAIGIWQPPSVNPAAFLVWLWPTLYAIHAILIVAGVPIQFDRPWIFLNMLIPIAGYGILCGLMGHIYSRYALKKLKGLTHLEGEEGNEA